MTILEGIVIGNKLKDTVLVEVVRRTPHSLYGKLIKRSKTYKVDTKGITVAIGDRVKIAETKPISKDKHFKVMEVVKGAGK